MSETALIKQQQGDVNPIDRLGSKVVKMAPELARALPKHLNADRLLRIVLTTVRLNPKLGGCDHASVLGSILTAAQLGLEVGTPLGHAYLVPYKLECKLIIGYQGMIELARRSGVISNIYAYVVREGDKFSCRYGLHRNLEHEPSSDAKRLERPITHVYAVAHQKGSSPDFVVLSKPEIDARRARAAKKGQEGPWVEHEEAMTLKTAVRALWKWLPKSIDMQRAEAVEQTDDADKPQALGWDPAITAALEAHDMQVDLTEKTAEQEASAAPPEEVDPKELGNHGVKNRLAARGQSKGWTPPTDQLAPREAAPELPVLDEDARYV